MSLYNEKQIIKNRKNAANAKLDAPDWFWLAEPACLVGVCNGVGPEHLPSLARNFITGIMRNLQYTAMIHDVDYEKSDGTEESRAEADRRFLFNAIKESKHHYRWFDLRRWILQLKALICFFMLEEYGKQAWDNAFNNNQKESHK